MMLSPTFLTMLLRTFLTTLLRTFSTMLPKMPFGGVLEDVPGNVVG